MKGLVSGFQLLWENYAFGVCHRLGEKLGVATWSVRLFFIYASFITYGSPIFVYLALAFIMKLRKFQRKRSAIWDF